MEILNKVVEKNGEKIFAQNIKSLDAILKTFGPWSNEIAALFLSNTYYLNDVEWLVRDEGVIPAEPYYGAENFKAGYQALYCFVKQKEGVPLGLVPQDIRHFKITDHDTAIAFVNSLGLSLQDDLSKAIGKTVSVYKNAFDLYAVGIKQE